MQAKINEEDMLARERAQKEQEANDALINTWDNIQAKINADAQLAQRLHEEEQLQLTDAEKAKLFMEVLWRLVKDRFVKTKQVDYMDRFLLHTLKTMFEHHVEDNVWKNQQGLAKV
nr:hypothetical protein [Tanacetum cinerariifolium]